MSCPFCLELDPLLRRADLILALLSHHVGSGEDLTIRELPETVAEVVGCQGGFVQDSSKPDGIILLVMDVSKILIRDGVLRVDLSSGIAATYENFKDRS